MNNKYIYATILIVVIVSSIAAYAYFSKTTVSVNNTLPTPSSAPSSSPTATSSSQPSSTASPTSGSTSTSTATPSPSPSATPSGPTTQTLVDQAGRTVTLPMNPTRVVVTTPWMAEVLLTFGCFSDIVGVPALAQSPQVGVLQYYQNQLDALTNVGTPPNVNIETIIGLNPDLVIEATRMPSLESELNTFNIPWIYVNQAGTPESQLQLVGDAMGAYTLTNQLLGEMNATYALIASRLQAAGITPAQYVPLIVTGFGTDPTVLMTQHDADYVLRAAGTYNIFENATPVTDTTIPFETILVDNPQYIIVNSYYPTLVGTIENNPSWQAIAAVQNNHVYLEPVDTHFLFRQEVTHIAALWVAKMVYPQLFTDINIQTEMNNFWLEYYHTPFPGTVPPF